MSIYHFIALDEKRKRSITFSGTLLDAVIFEDKHYILYSVEDFFVEVIYHPKAKDYERILPFRTTKRLEKYIQNYQLPEVAWTVCVIPPEYFYQFYEFNYLI